MSREPTVRFDSTELAYGIVVAIAIGAVFEGIARVGFGTSLPGWLATVIFFAALAGFYLLRA